MKKLSLGLFAGILIILFGALLVKRNEVVTTADFNSKQPEKLIVDSSARDNKSQAEQGVHPEPMRDNKLQSNASIRKENQLALQDSREVIRNDPYFPAEVSDKLFDFLDADQLVQNLQKFDSRTPRNDGRIEILDENGLVKVTDYRSPQEDIDLGFDEVNRLRDQVKKEQISTSELIDLDKQGDPAASFELARRAFKVNDVAAAEAYIIRAAKLSNSPAPLTLAGLFYDVPTSEAATRISKASWFLAAYARGDYTVATRLRSSMGHLSIEYQNLALEMAAQILAELDG